MSVELIFQKLNHYQRGIELNYTNSFTCLIAVILSARTTDKQVNKATEILFQKISTPEDILKLGLSQLTAYIQTIGLYTTKAKHIMETCTILIERYNSQIPTTREELETLPGVGRKTANVVLNEIFKQPTFPVDTHVFRVCNRLGITSAKNPLQTEEQLQRIVPAIYRLHAAHNLVLHGRYVCKARKPLCEQCPLIEYCHYYQEQSAK